METPHIIAWLIGYGFIGITCLAAIEKFVPLFPSYVLLMLLGMTIPDTYNLIAIIAATTLGSTAGACCWFAIGRTLGGERVAIKVKRYGKFIFLSTRLYDRLTNAYRRNHFWVTLVGQTIPTARVYLALPAGILKLDFLPFSAATLLGSLLWNAPFLFLGYLLRTSRYDPYEAGFWAAVCLLGLETVIVAVATIYRRRPPRQIRLADTIVKNDMTMKQSREPNRQSIPIQGPSTS
ncbi:DedA family protein (plasmid) [Phyllobacterium sp. 628]|uniref:DedA family protein n=1 Tax=Phyllobacterium sp. 628 TaxID=2718938 RepID=UPI00166236F4|nr:DedA family protein [Phyllobacterium sp. 628]QND54793.1 DedA family protein [Phyllobacterium sp. 628]